MAVSKRAKSLYNSFFDGLETSCANTISNYQEKRYLKKYCTTQRVPIEFKNSVKQYWSKYVGGGRLNSIVKFAWYYASQNGIMDPKYIPNTLYYAKIDQYFNNRKLGWGFNDNLSFASKFQPLSSN